MRVIVDTNVLVSGIYHSGIPARILDAWSDGRFEIVASEPLLVEVREVVARLQGLYPTVEASPVLDRIVRECELFDPVSVPADFCDDPDDLIFIACAIAGRADGIVSGDKALLRSTERTGIEVWRPREFLGRLP